LTSSSRGLGALTEDEVNAIDYAGSSTRASASPSIDPPCDTKLKASYSDSDLELDAQRSAIPRSAKLGLLTLLTLLFVHVGIFISCTLPAITSIWPGSELWILAAIAVITGYLVIRTIRVYRTRMVMESRKELSSCEFP
jgi:hypothetical protein